MNEKRPTRKEAEEVAMEAIRRCPAGVSSIAAGVEAVAALFGGFAPEPVEVPWFALPTSIRLHEMVLGRELELVVMERSNAWEELRSLIQAAFLPGTYVGCLGQLTAAKNLMDRPEMGVGPHKK